jgi:hypothetical protein
MVSAALVMCATSAADAPGWPNEPTSVLGIPLGKSIPHRLLDCPYPLTAGGAAPHDVCMVRIEGRRDSGPIQLLALPFTDIRVSAFMKLTDGNVSEFEFDVDHADYERFKRILIERYGPPSRTTASQFTAYSGASVSGEVLQWKGEHSAIVAWERRERIDRSVVVIGDIALITAEKEADDQRIKAEAAKF